MAIHLAIYLEDNPLQKTTCIQWPDGILWRALPCPSINTPYLGDIAKNSPLKWDCLESF